MKLYSIESPIKSSGDVIDIRDPKGMLSSYFIWGEGDGKFLNFMTPQGNAQKNIRYSDLSKADFLPANIGIPIFSEKAKHEIDSFIPDQVEWVKITISCEGSNVTYHLCKTKSYLDLVDREQSVFRLLTDGEPVLSKAVYKENIADDFIIGRDVNFKERLVVSQRFVDFCHAKKLKINFDDPV